MVIDDIAHKLDAELRRDRRYHADCPFCGKEAKRSQTHFSFCDDGYYCWVCGAKGGITTLAIYTGNPVVPDPQNTRRFCRKSQEPRNTVIWRNDAIKILSSFCGAPVMSQAWQSYKPLSIDSIARFRLGLGVLPASRCKMPRLILPVFYKSEIVAFHGRAYLTDDTDAKWLCSGGSRKDVLFNGDMLHEGAHVIICENFVDAILAMQESNCIAVTGGGCGWREEWTEQVVTSKPSRVLVWLDNDLAGSPNPETYDRLIREFRSAHPGLPDPEPHGPRIATEFAQRHVPVSLYRWPSGTPAKADLGWAIAQRNESKKAAA